MEVKFRIAEYKDVENILKLCNECFEEPLDFEYAKQIFKETESDKNQIYLIGEVEDEIVAHAKITIIPTIYKEMNNFALLNHVCVKPEYRRHNIATKMLYQCERIASENNCKKINLWSANFRKPAHACYKGYGYKMQDMKFFSKEVDWEIL